MFAPLQRPTIKDRERYAIKANNTTKLDTVLLLSMMISLHNACIHAVKADDEWSCHIYALGASGDQSGVEWSGAIHFTINST